MGMISRKGVWVEFMGVASACGCKKAYKFPRITYPYSLCTSSFWQHHSYFLSLCSFLLELVDSK